MEFRRIQDSRSKVDLAQVALLSKMTALLASQDPMTFQAIQAMENYSAEAPGDVEGTTEAELDALLERHDAGEHLSEEEYERIDASTIGEFRGPLE
jgi:ribosome assembly protein YihI (activator of Der GTPase)